VPCRTLPRTSTYQSLRRVAAVVSANKPPTRRSQGPRRALERFETTVRGDGHAGTIGSRRSAGIASSSRVRDSTAKCIEFVLGHGGGSFPSFVTGIASRARLWCLATSASMPRPRSVGIKMSLGVGRRRKQLFSLTPARRRLNLQKHSQIGFR
jgi:hypothetical protein